MPSYVLQVVAFGSLNCTAAGRRQFGFALQQAGDSLVHHILGKSDKVPFRNQASCLVVFKFKKDERDGLVACESKRTNIYGIRA
jgi:hypothetical protein